MAVFKCKMCGGTIEFSQGDTIGVCDSCGTKQTLPNVKDDAINSLYNRANTLRLKSEFDRAEELYNKIIAYDETQAEAYWGIILCKFGIEYVEDPKTFKRVPTCHRTSFDAITADEDFKLAVEYGDAEQRELYKAEAKEIDSIQKDILNIAKNEKPFDVFLCYKETDDSGKRTQDSVIANDIYYQLTQEGFKVFYAAITLEDKLGQEYEPYIFAALNSAKVMLVIGSRPEYFTSVWVKNEWSRFLKIMKKDRSRMLIPCYKDMDAYELPDDFAHLQAQDMSKIGFINDVVRGIKKVINNDSHPKKLTAEKEAVVMQNENGNVRALIDRGFMALEDGEWEKADGFFEQALNFDAKIAEAYLGKLMAELKVTEKEKLSDCEQPFDNINNYQKAIRFGDEALVASLHECIAKINERNENNRLAGIYSKAQNTMRCATTEQDFFDAADYFSSIKQYSNSNELAKQCNAKAVQIRKERLAKEEAERLEQKRKAEEARIAAEKARKRAKKISAISTSCFAFLIISIVFIKAVIIPGFKYNKAIAELNNGNTFQAVSLLMGAKNYKDSDELLMTLLPKTSISAGDSHTLGLKSDGTPIAVGFNDYGQCDVFHWKDIVSISAGRYHTVGLKSDGTVVAAGFNQNGQCDVSGWEKILSISSGSLHTLGLRRNGTVIAIGNNGYEQCNVSEWKNMVAISAGRFHSVGLKNDGKVVAVGRNEYGQCNVSEWNNIIAISAGNLNTVGLKSDGTVVAVGDSSWDQCDVSDWTDIVAISASDYHTVGLKSDGTVIAVGRNEDGQCNVSKWKNIVAITAGDYYTVGLKSDGTVIAVGRNQYGKCNVSDWKDIKLPDNKQQ